MKVDNLDSSDIEEAATQVKIEGGNGAVVAHKNTEPARSNTYFHNLRYIIIILGGVSMGVMLCLRLTITVAIVSMVNRTALYLLEHPNSTVEEFFPPDYVENGEFVWTNEIQQTILTGYMLAYTIPQFFTTRLCMKYGYRNFIPLCLTTCAASCILTPILSYYGWQVALLLRLLNGVGASAVLPSMVNAIEDWMPPGDSPKGVALFQFVSNIFLVTTPFISGELSSIHWKWAFYIPGIFGIAFSILWWFIISDHPSKSHFISQKELDLIAGDDKKVKNTSQKVVKEEVEKQNPSELPWYFMFKLGAFYPLMINWSLYCATIGGFLFLLPTYMNRVLKVHVEDVGLLNSTVQIGALFCMLWFDPFSRFLMSQFKMSLTAARRIVVFITVFMVTITFGYLALFHNHLVPVICLNRFFHMTNDTIILATIMSQFGKEGLSGLVYSMMNTIGNETTILFCWATGRFLDHTGETLECWSWVFTVMIILNWIYLLIYTLFCKSEPVPVLKPKHKNKDEINEKV